MIPETAGPGEINGKQQLEDFCSKARMCLLPWNTEFKKVLFP